MTSPVVSSFVMRRNGYESAASSLNALTAKSARTAHSSSSWQPYFNRTSTGNEVIDENDVIHIEAEVSRSPGLHDSLESEVLGEVQHGGRWAAEVHRGTSAAEQ